MVTQTALIYSAAVVIVLAVAALVWLALRGMRSLRLRRKYGSEYDYTVEQSGDRHAAEETLREREKRIHQMDIRDLDAQESDQYHAKWMEVQAEFVDQPAESVEQADELINEVLERRGLPTADFEQRAADISVISPAQVTKFREAHAISVKGPNDGASTEDFRQALIDYRFLFEDLINKDGFKKKEEKNGIKEKEVQTS